LKNLKEKIQELEETQVVYDYLDGLKHKAKVNCTLAVQHNKNYNYAFNGKKLLALVQEDIDKLMVEIEKLANPMGV